MLASTRRCWKILSQTRYASVGVRFKICITTLHYLHLHLAATTVKDSARRKPKWAKDAALCRRSNVKLQGDLFFLISVLTHAHFCFSGGEATRDEIETNEQLKIIMPEEVLLKDLTITFVGSESICEVIVAGESAGKCISFIRECRTLNTMHTILTISFT